MPMTDPLLLTEWSASTAVRLTPDQRDVLRTTFSVTVQPTPGVEGRYDVTPGNVVGATVCDGRRITILPKVPIDRVMFLLGYVTGSRHWIDGDAGMAPRIDLVDAVASLFLRVAHRAIDRGLLAGYHEVHEVESTVRGRIDLAEQLRRRPGLSSPIALSYAQHDHDILENQLLLSATLLLARLPLRDPRVRQQLRRLEESFPDVTPLLTPRRDLPAVHWTRLNGYYRPAVELARLLLSGASPELAPGTVSTDSLRLDMSEVFEDFVRTALAEAAHLSPAQFPDGDHCSPLFLDDASRVRLKPDLSLRSGTDWVFVGDVKYKRDVGPGHSADLYQLHVYAAATQLSEATLIYAYGPAGVKTHQVRHEGPRLHIRHLDLAQPPQALLRDVAHLAEELLPPARPQTRQSVS